MTTLNDLFVMYNETVDGIGPGWMWVKQDVQTWGIIKYEWENSHKENVLKYCKDFDVIIQAGGNCGMYPKLYSRMFKRVYTFEPDPINFFCLAYNCVDPNIAKIQAGLMDKHGTLEIQHVEPINVGMHKVEMKQSGFVPALMIDDLELEKLDMIHLDIEVTEIYALNGAVKTLEKHRPVLFIEFGDKPPVSDFLTDMNYEFVGNSRSDAIWLPK